MSDKKIVFGSSKISSTLVKFNWFSAKFHSQKFNTKMQCVVCSTTGQLTMQCISGQTVNLCRALHTCCQTLPICSIPRSVPTQISTSAPRVPRCVSRRVPTPRGASSAAATLGSLSIPTVGPALVRNTFQTNSFQCNVNNSENPLTICVVRNFAAW